MKFVLQRILAECVSSRQQHHLDHIVIPWSLISSQTYSVLELLMLLMLGILGVVCFQQFPSEISANFFRTNQSEADHSDRAV
jgi:hypothetical protein